MKKYLILVGLFLLSTSAIASRDSIAFFYTPAKVNILINERGMDSRLHDFMNHFNAGNELILESEKGDITLGCAREINKVACRFTFTPSNNVAIENKELAVLAKMSSFGIMSDDSFEMSFRGSMKDNMSFTIEHGVLKIFASKK